MRTIGTLFVTALFASVVVAEQSDQAAVLDAAKKAVEARLSPPQNTGTVRLMNVAASAVPKAGGVLAVTIQPPSTEKFEWHAETIYIQIWQALAKVPNAYKHLSRIVFGYRVS